MSNKNLTSNELLTIIVIILAGPLVFTQLNDVCTFLSSLLDGIFGR